MRVFVSSNIKLPLLFCCAIAFIAGFIVERTAAQPLASMIKGTANTSDTTKNWPAPGTGSMYSTQGTTWVLGSASLTTPGNKRYNDWVESSARREFTGSITNADFPVWWVYARARYEIKASVTYNPTTPVVLERHRAETTLQLQAWGDVSGIIENRVVVDDTAITGTTTYDVVGADGGTYAGAGEEYAENSPAIAGTTEALLLPEIEIDQWVTGANIHFYLRAYGKQYIHNDKEEDAASVNTYIGALDPTRVGYEGFIVGYDFDQSTGLLTEALFIVGDGLIP